MFRQESAQTLALQVLGWLAGQDGSLHAFLAASGTNPDELRDRAADPLLLAAVLDFLLSDEALVTAFCTENGLPFSAPLEARAVLPGGDTPFWT